MSLFLYDNYLYMITSSQDLFRNFQSFLKILFWCSLFAHFIYLYFGLCSLKTLFLQITRKTEKRLTSIIGEKSLSMRNQDELGYPV